ncbi:chemokine-like receptor 1 [Rana temporaria]|uniref:chemokine-like receptor 1 n=1 Tax=Rana temporaria TaxID=8407 RepID=UPI001AAD3238|nr:chemokine-like receptor 1 [Rana temporaria]
MENSKVYLNISMTYVPFTATPLDKLEDTYSTDGYDEYEDNTKMADMFHYISIVIYSVAFLLGTTGNGLVIYFTAFKMKRTVNVVWFLNLAIADFIFTFFLLFSIVHSVLDFHWPFGKFMCMLNTAIISINLYASIFLLAMISIDRCTSVMFPVWCQNHRTPRVASFAALAVWILAFLFSLPYFIFRDTRETTFNNAITCFSNFHEDPDVVKSIYKGMIILRLIFAFIIPFSLIILCYVIIMFRIQRNRMKTSSKPFKIILAVIISFFICWFPYHVFSFVELSAMYPGNEHLNNVIRIGIPLTTSLAFINSCINPVLYVLMGRDFKTRLRKSFRSVLEKAFMEESVPASFRSKTRLTRSTLDSEQV